MTVKELYEFLSQLYGINDIYKYAKENGIEISYYAIQNDNTLTLVSGREFKSGTVIMEQNIGSQIQGAYLDNQNIEGESENFILLSLRNNLLPNENESISLFTEMIAIHELAHFIDQQNLVSRLDIKLDGCDNEVGSSIEREANKVAEQTGVFQDLVHNRNFGGILNHLIRSRYGNLYPKFMKISMSKTLIHIENSKFYRC